LCLHQCDAQLQSTVKEDSVSLSFSQIGEMEANAPCVTSIQYVGQGWFYDISVFPWANYEAEGVIHHNSGKTAASAKKCGRFLVKQAPPRKDTPFWVISQVYDQSMGVCWAEKLWGQQFIPHSEVEYDRITWHSTKRNWPYSVPLKPHSNGNNWVIEFKSYEQGWQALQAFSIGGFWFSEQFPWNRFLEVLRGCRDYMFPGGQFCEFTPLDPDLCIHIEKIQDNPPSGWEFFRLNTEANRENLARDWYDSFFGAVPEEMMATRKTGALATFEGVIYQTFNPMIHTTSEDSKVWLPGMEHYRSVDWGASTEHPFVALWGTVDSMGEWLVYDEYWNNRQDCVTLDHVIEILARSIFWGWPEPRYFKGSATRLQQVVIDEVRRRLRELRSNGLSEALMSRVSYDEKKFESRYHETFCDPSRPGEMNLFSEMGLMPSGASNVVKQGIDFVRSLFKVRPSTEAPGLQFHTRCKHCIEEHRKYRWKKRKHVDGFTEAPPPEPLKKDDDTCDATRYLTVSEARGRGVKPDSTTSVKDDYQRQDVQIARHREGGLMRGLLSK
jgi:hypothetical protein